MRISISASLPALPVHFPAERLVRLRRVWYNRGVLI